MKREKSRSRDNSHDGRPTKRERSKSHDGDQEEAPRKRERSQSHDGDERLVKRENMNDHSLAATTGEYDLSLMRDPLRMILINKTNVLCILMV